MLNNELSFENDVEIPFMLEKYHQRHNKNVREFMTNSKRAAGTSIKFFIIREINETQCPTTTTTTASSCCLGESERSDVGVLLFTVEDHKLLLDRFKALL